MRMERNRTEVEIKGESEGRDVKSIWTKERREEQRKQGGE